METVDAQLRFAFKETSSRNGDGEILVWLSRLLVDLRIKRSFEENSPYCLAWWKARHLRVGTRLEPYGKANLLRPLDAVLYLGEGSTHCCHFHGKLKRKKKTYGTNNLNHDLPSPVDLCVWCGRSDERSLSTDNCEEQD